MNEMKIQILALAENELVIRTALVAFLLPLNPTNDELLEIKTICAEAVVNAIVHAYPHKKGNVEVQAKYDEKRIVYLTITDEGIGMDHIQEKRQSFVTTKETEEHSGMGFTIMETFSDSMKVTSVIHQGTTVQLTRALHDFQ